ncbi:unnamed protein product [Brassica napus]|uniref:(rape) hypothetical protein n=1 Tax=Brassica napus TaxID=3708 RepID=A0A816TJK8_BRANA|nr:unnamed protein product [Brassica napus]
MNSMPTDLIVDIFSRLPAKSVAVCCCVSKLWASILNSQDFRELFLTRSSSRPRLLFAIQGTYNNIWRFFSSPQPHYSSDKSSHEVTADSYMKYLEDMRPYFCSYASGLIWRNIHCSLPHQGPNEGICINGIFVLLGFYRCFMAVFSNTSLF